MLDDRLSTRLSEVLARFEEVERRLGDPGVSSDPTLLRDLGKEHAELQQVVLALRTYRSTQEDLAAARDMLKETPESDAGELRAEMVEMERRSEELEAQLRELLTPKDPMDEKDVLVEIRAAAGGDEAGLFARELMDMYQRYAEGRGWKTEVLSENATGIGGIKEATMAVKGKRVFSRLKFESGVHRVQRVPQTESQGRIHTSTATIAVLPEAEDVDVQIDPKDLKIDVYRSSGPGGQSVNTTDSAVRITHLPTGEVVACQEERSQLQNRERAMRILRARLLQRAQEERRARIAADRKGQVGTGERSEKIRTYNFPQNRVTDHRVNIDVFNLPGVLDGNLDAFIDALVLKDRADRLGGGNGRDGS